MDPELPVYNPRSIEDTIGMIAGVATRKLVLYLVGVLSAIGTLTMPSPAELGGVMEPVHRFSQAQAN